MIFEKLTAVLMLFQAFFIPLFFLFFYLRPVLIVSSYLILLTLLL